MHLGSKAPPSQTAVTCALMEDMDPYEPAAAAESTASGSQSHYMLFDTEPAAPNQITAYLSMNT